MRKRQKFRYYERVYNDFGYGGEYYIGEEAQQLRGVLKIVHPIHHEIIEDWNIFEKILHYSLNNVLRIDPSERIVVFCPPYNLLSRGEIENITEIFFEIFKIKGLCIVNPGFASLTSINKNTGTVVYVGDDMIHVSNFLNGQVLRDTIKSANYGFRDLINFTIKQLSQKGHTFTTSQEKLWVEDICTKFSYVALELEREMQSLENKKKEYTLPDGRIISIQKNRFEPAELFFKPELVGKDEFSMQKLIYESRSQIDIDLKSSFNEVILTGIGVIPGMDSRLEKELKEISDSQDFIVKINPLSSNSEFVGASILGQNKEYLNKHVYSLGEFKDFGPQGIHEYY